MRLGDHPDGALAQVGTVLVDEIEQQIRDTAADGLMVFHRGGVTGHPDHAAATAAALQAATRTRRAVLEWTLPADVAEQLNRELSTAFTGVEPADIDIVLPVDRARQCQAITAHASQAAPASPLWRRLQLLGGYEYLQLNLVS